MSAVIQVLPEFLINQIAAGEVVERPASVVKELLENAADAEADDIQVDILQEGKSSIRVADNGLGMTREDLLLAVERHATSKIREYADLMSLRSMGFRGEALPSIAAVSRMTLLSVPRGSITGHRLEIQGGAKRRVEETGGASGTTVEVADLFFNTPARMAFLKSPRAEWNQIQMAFERVALGFPSLRFGLTHNGKRILHLFPAQDLIFRLKSLWGPERTNDLIPMESTADGVRITGFLSPPHLHQNTSRYMALVVNQRWVRSPLLYPLILRAYAAMIPSGRFPTAVLWMEVPPELIDINIHPFKQEVRFSQPAWIQSLVGKALERALKSHVPRAMEAGGREEAFFPKDWVKAQSQPFLFKESSLPLSLIPYASSEGSEGPKPSEAGDMERGFSSLTLLAQLRGTYLLAQMEGGLILIDQHAAHERILYDKYLHQWRTGGVASQYLIVPILIELPPGWSMDIESIQPQLTPFGFEITPAGGNSLWLKSLPVGVPPGPGEEAFKEIMEKIKNEGELIKEETFSSSLLKLLACHSAIRAGQILSGEEMKSLLSQLDQTESPSHCPHGRPLWFEISWEEIEKRFKRR
jgi:DNA mismatch repair protein MutL